MADNPLKQYFRQPGAYVKLPTKGKWYTSEDITLSADSELAVYPMGAIDEILINTPDAMLNGQALEKVVKNCVPDIVNVKKILSPDLDVIFLGIKKASNNGVVEHERKCPNCKHENLFDIDADSLLINMTDVDSAVTKIEINDLTIHIKPYNFEMRQMWIKREFEEEKTIQALDAKNSEADELEKAKVIGESVERIAKLTFDLVSRSIEKIHIKKSDTLVTDSNHISEFLTSIKGEESEKIIAAIDELNRIGIAKEFFATCQNCGHQWSEKLNFDPTSFFGKQSRRPIRL